MNKDELDQLIAKYYDGETSEAEDQLLQQVLSENGMAPEYAPEHAVMAFYASEKAIELSPEFDVGFMSVVERDTSRTRIKTLVWSGAIAAVLAVLAFVIFLFTNEEPTIITINAGPQEKKEIRLPDGSAVFLNYNSAIRYAKDFELREISLTGEAYFDVATDKDHPFRISTAGSVTEVVGTSFNLRSTEGLVELVVVTGSVAFSTFKDNLQERIFLTQGNRAVFDRTKNLVTKYERSDPNSIAWKTGQLTFSDAPMDEVIKVLGRYFNKSITTADTLLVNCHFKAAFNSPQLPEVIDVLEFTMNIKTEMKGDTLRLYGKGCVL
jgi:transmembrane sensor